MYTSAHVFILYDKNKINQKEWHVATNSLRDNLRGQKSLGPLKMSLEMAHKVILPPKKIISRSFLNSGTLIVIILLTDLSFSVISISPSPLLHRFLFVRGKAN
jgi:hypothetical protein